MSRPPAYSFPRVAAEDMGKSYEINVILDEGLRRNYELSILVNLL